MKLRKFFIEIIFWLHLPLVIVWFGLFFIPKSIWLGKVAFHFWYIFSIMLIQFIWSLVVFRKFDLICPLTTWMQYLRGFSLQDKNNYGHGYIAELLLRLRVKVSFKFVSVLLIFTLIVVAVQYFFFN